MEQDIGHKRKHLIKVLKNVVEPNLEIAVNEALTSLEEEGHEIGIITFVVKDKQVTLDKDKEDVSNKDNVPTKTMRAFTVIIQYIKDIK